MKLSKESMSVIGLLISVVTCGYVGNNDYEDKLIVTHHTCTDHPNLSQCVDYDPTEYNKYIAEKKGK